MCFFSLQTLQCWQKDRAFHCQTPGKTQDLLRWVLLVISWCSPQTSSSRTSHGSSFFFWCSSCTEVVGKECPKVPKKGDAALYTKRGKTFDISSLFSGWRWKAGGTVDIRWIMISKGSAWGGHRAKSDTISITGRDEEKSAFPSPDYSFFTSIRAVLSSFFSGCCYSKSLGPKLWKINTLPLGNFPWQSCLWFPWAVGCGLRWHPSRWQWFGPPLLQLSSDCNATSSKPKDQQLLWKYSRWLQRTLDPASHSGQTPGIPEQPKQLLLTAEAVGT